MSASMAVMFKWPLVALDCAPGVRRHQLAICNPVERSLLVPIAADVVPMLPLQVAAVEVNMERAMQIASSMDDALRVTSCLGQVEASVGEWIPSAMLRDVNFGTITSLAEVGVLALRDSEFLGLE
eukprot:8944364-Pyramimonas_sp.AAC.1